MSKPLLRIDVGDRSLLARYVAVRKKRGVNVPDWMEAKAKEDKV